MSSNFSIQLMPRRLSSPLLPLLPHLLLPFFTRPINPITISSSSTRLLVPGSRMDHHQSSDKEKESDQMRECCGKGACEFNAERNRVSDRLMPHILNLYGSRATARDFDIYAADASFEDPLMCAHGVKQIKSAFYSLSKVFGESSIVEYNIKEKMESQGKYEILIDNKQSYKFMGRYIDMISLIRLHVVDGKVIRHEDCFSTTKATSTFAEGKPCLNGKDLPLSVHIRPLSPGEVANVPSEVIIKAGAVLNFSVRQVQCGHEAKNFGQWDKKPLKNRDTVDFPLVGRIIEAARRGSMMVTHAMMGLGKDPSA